MGLSLTLCEELANLDKDADSRKSALEALKSFVKELDKETIPLFLNQLAETEGPGSITLYEILARVHGSNIVPHIDNIITNIVKTLKSNAGSFALHQACSKVVPAIAKHCIRPLVHDAEKAAIISSLCNPLCDILMGPSENAASGAALCLKSLVESDVWKFAPDDVVNDICLRVVGALQERLTQTNSHMGLAMALAKSNSLTLEAFARSLVQSGVQILTATSVNSQRRLSAIQMINFLMKCVDSRSIFSELVEIIHVMEKCRKDQMPFVRGAAFEALQTAGKIAAEKGSNFLKDSSPSWSNFSCRRDNERMTRNSPSVSTDPSVSHDESLRSLSPQSRSTSCFSGFDSFTESTSSAAYTSSNFECGSSGNCRQWNENCSFDAALQNGIYSEAKSCNLSKFYFDRFNDGEYSDMEEVNTEVFPGSITDSPKTRGTAQSLQILQSDFDNIDIRRFAALQKHPSSLQGLDYHDLETIGKRDQTSSEAGEISIEETNEMDVSQDLSHGLEVNLAMKEYEEIQNILATDNELGPDGSILMSITCNAAADGSCNTSYGVNKKEKNATEGVHLKMRKFGKASVSMIFGVALLVPAVVLSAFLLNYQEDGFSLVPT